MSLVFCCYLHNSIIIADNGILMECCEVSWCVVYPVLHGLIQISVANTHQFRVFYVCFNLQSSK